MAENHLNVLVVDDEKKHADVLAEALGKSCAKVEAVYDPVSAIDHVYEEKVDVVVTDLNLNSDMNGIDLMHKIRGVSPETEVILITAYASIETCKRAIREGAYDYLEKPIEIDRLRKMVADAGEKFTFPNTSAPLQVSVKPKAAGKDGFKYSGVISTSPAMKHVFKVIQRVSPTDIGVLIEGESGTGKELLAHAVHINSNRADCEYRPINCAGLSETLLESELFGHAKGAFTGAVSDRKGLFEIADQGTLFLDEIGDMPMSMQAKLLRVLEDGIITPVGSTRSIKVDVRIVSATNCDLAKLVEEKKFRQDLYYRIKGVSVTIPPLRNRPEDIPDLVYYFLSQTCADLGVDMLNISEKAMDILLNYTWPGNIRQLKHALRIMVVMCEGEMIDVQDIPPEINSVLRLGEGPVSTANLAGKALVDVEKEAISSTLKLVDGNREKASKMLGIGERTLYRKIKEYDL